jgi:nucleoside-diphosphate-sugar epimerase
MGRRLCRLLVGGGHEVAGMTRTPANASVLDGLGVVPVVCDVFDRGAVTDAVVAWAPDVVIHQLTDLPDDASLVPDFLDGHARIRSEGTRNLLDAATAAGVARLIAQSVAWLPATPGSPVGEMERMVLEADGVVLRYGQWYGPDTYYENVLPPRPRIHIDRAAERTVDVLAAGAGIITVIED